MHGTTKHKLIFRHLDGPVPDHKMKAATVAQKHPVASLLELGLWLLVWQLQAHVTGKVRACKLQVVDTSKCDLNLNESLLEDNVKNISTQTLFSSQKTWPFQGQFKHVVRFQSNSIP